MDDLKIVEIEIHSYCNRLCSWCPNSSLDRHFYEVLPMEAYRSLIRDLKIAAFSGYISFSRYNEPTYNLDLLAEYISVIKALELNVKIVFNTNGDYLDFNKLRDIPVNEITIMDYDCRGSEYFYPYLKEAGLKELKIDGNYITGFLGKSEILTVLNWPVHAEIVDRGGILRNKSFPAPGKPEIDSPLWKMDRRLRDFSCYEPGRFLGIDYNGSVTPCCNIRSDYPGHTEFILGNIKDRSIIEILESEKAVNFRDILSSDEIDLFPFPCLHCHKEPGRYTRNNPGISYMEVKQ